MARVADSPIAFIHMVSVNTCFLKKTYHTANYAMQKRTYAINGTSFY